MQMRTRHLASTTFGSLLATVVACGLWAAPAANASPAGAPQSQNVQTVQFGYPYYHRGYPYHWGQHWWRHRYWRHNRWRYYN